MAEIPDSLRTLFETSVEETTDGYAVSIPDEFVENGSLSVGETYRVAMLASETAASTESTAATSSASSASATSTESERAEPASSSDSSASVSASASGTDSSSSGSSSSSSSSRSGDRNQQEPPVEEGEVRKVAIDTLGDQGDGIARVERGFIVIVPGTQPGDTVEVEITDVKDTVAFAEPISEPTVR